jgi:hypothetical protein
MEKYTISTRQECEYKDSSSYIIHINGEVILDTKKSSAMIVEWIYNIAGFNWDHTFSPLFNI